MEGDTESPSPTQSLSQSPPKTFRPDRQAASLLDQSDDPGGVDATLAAYDKKALTKVLHDLELNLEQ